MRTMDRKFWLSFLQTADLILANALHMYGDILTTIFLLTKTVFVKSPKATAFLQDPDYGRPCSCPVFSLEFLFAIEAVLWCEAPNRVRSQPTLLKKEEPMPLPRIVLLPPELCNQIAAGEVVERPASVVKELVENSLDALSTFIEVRLENGGQGLIRVQDNGTGMAREDLELALTRHATSKIRTVEDLENINSYGFRGEALPSVASVSRCTLTSVPQGSDEAWTCRVTFGRLEGMEPSSLHRGTIVEVRDLFANVPARLKFLRGIPTEVKHCQDWLSRLALTRADVTFRLESEGRELVHFKSGQDVFDRLQFMWPKLVTENLVSLDRVAYGMRVHGFVSRPGVSQPKSNRILIFVNGRSVSDKKIFAAIREAYKGKITSRDHPQAVLFLELDPHEVDVNVHPAKSEVRFRDEKSVFRAILAAVGQTLERAGSANTPVTETIFQDSEDAGPGQEVQKAPFSADSGIHEASSRQEDRNDNCPDAPLARPFVSRPVGFWGKADEELNPGMTIGRSREQETDIEWFVPEEDCAAQANASQGNVARDADSFRVAKAFPEEPAKEDAARYEPLSFTSRPLPAEEEKIGPCEDEDFASGTIRGVTYLGQVAETYLVLRDAAGALLLLDQHAAHERVLYARIRARGYCGEGQGLAVPLELSLHASESQRFFEVAQRLAELGFAARMSGMTLIVRAIPALLQRSEAMQFLREVLAGTREEMDARFASMACKSAIKAGDTLARDEALSLLRQWLATPDREYCPHGRPIVLRWDKAELERLFKRRQS